ncbi:hypothetical protein ACFPYN_05575 [Paenisporosarcina macmurdoensis]|uniref:Uncharacterized protein n=1 Tax=Paenisporosarcina macmurdoensis TaxID=212659 RepID=A0ABW1L6Y1_9BACL
MDIAILHGEFFDIEQKRRSLENPTKSRKEIVNKIDNEYRVFSKKGAFICICCNTPVKMNLTTEELRPFYFSHFDSRECSYSENHKVYQKQQETSEDNMTKQVEITVLREILEGQLKPLNIDIQRGYLYKKRLSFVPDFILTFPNEKKWAIDYHTSIQLGRDNLFVKQLNRRKQVYADEGFQVFSFVGENWLAFNEDTGKGTLLKTESNFVMKTKADFEWDKFIFQLNAECLDMLNETLNTDSLSVDTQSIQYLNVNERTCKIVRFLHTADSNDRNTTIQSLASPITIPLSSALTLNEDQTGFHLVGDQEDALRNDFKQKLFRIVEESKVVVESVKPTYPMYLKPPPKEEELPDLPKFSLLNKGGTIYIKESRQTAPVQDYDDYDPEYEQVLREMAERAELASHRPIDKSPEQWERELYGNPTPTYIAYPHTSLKRSLEKTRDPFYEKKRMDFKDKILDSSIPGSHYIESGSTQWKLSVLRWVKEEMVNDAVQVSLPKVVIALKQEGIKFNQKDELIQYPVKAFLTYYQKELKKDLNQTITISYF